MRNYLFFCHWQRLIGIEPNMKGFLRFCRAMHQQYTRPTRDDLEIELRERLGEYQ